MGTLSLDLVGNPGYHFGKENMQMRSLVCAFIAHIILVCCILEPYSAHGLL